MNQERILGLIVTILVPFAEMALTSSHVDVLYNLRLIYLIALVYMLNNKRAAAILLVLVGSSLVEFLSFQSLLGLTAMSFFLAVAAVELTVRFWSLLSQDNYLLRSFLVFIFAIILKHLLSSLIGLHSTQIEPTVIFVNLLLFTVTMFIFERMKTPGNALKR